MKWDQVDLFRRVISLEHTKNGERLSIPINDTLMELFKSLAKVRHIRSPYVFCHRDGKRFQEIKKAFRQAIDEAKIRDFKFHEKTLLRLFSDSEGSHHLLGSEATRTQG